MRLQGCRGKHNANRRKSRSLTQMYYQRTQPSDPGCCQIRLSPLSVRVVGLGHPKSELRIRNKCTESRARALSQANRAHPCHTLAGSTIFPVLPKLQHSSFGCRSFGWGGAGGRRLFGGPVLRASVSGLGSLHGCLQSRV